MTLLMLLEMIASALRRPRGDRHAPTAASPTSSCCDRAGAGAEVHPAARGPPPGLRRRRATPPSRWRCSPPRGPGCRSCPLNYRLGRRPAARPCWPTTTTCSCSTDDPDAPARRCRRAPCSRCDEWHAATREPVERRAVDDRRRGHRRPALHERHHRGAQGRGAAPPPPHARTSSASVEFAGADEADATLVSVPPYHIAGVANVVSNVYAARRIVYLPAVHARGVARHRAGRGHQPRHGRAHDAGPRRRAPRRRRGRLRRPALAGLRRRPHAGDGARAGAGRLPRHRLRERLRPHRDELDDRRPRARRPPQALEPATTWPGAGSAPCGRLVPGIEVEIRDGEIWVRGEQVSGEYLGHGAARSTPTAGSPPATAAGSTRTATSSSRAAPTTRSSAAARTSRRPRSRTCCSPTRPWPQAAVVGLPDEEWGQRLAAAVVLRPGTSVEPRRAAGVRPRAAAVVEDARRDRLPRRPAAHRHRQAPAPRRPGRPARERPPDGLRPRPTSWRASRSPRSSRGVVEGAEPRHRLLPGLRRPDPRPGARRSGRTRRPRSR